MKKGGIVFLLFLLFLGILGTSNVSADTANFVMNNPYYYGLQNTININYLNNSGQVPLNGECSIIIENEKYTTTKNGDYYTSNNIILYKNNSEIIVNCSGLINKTKIYTFIEPNLEIIEQEGGYNSGIDSQIYVNFTSNNQILSTGYTCTNMNYNSETKLYNKTINLNSEQNLNFECQSIGKNYSKIQKNINIIPNKIFFTLENNFKYGVLDTLEIKYTEYADDCTYSYIDESGKPSTGSLVNNKTDRNLWYKNNMIFYENESFKIECFDDKGNPMITRENVHLKVDDTAEMITTSLDAPYLVGVSSKPKINFSTYGNQPLEGSLFSCKLDGENMIYNLTSKLYEIEKIVNKNQDITFICEGPSKIISETYNINPITGDQANLQIIPEITYFYGIESLTKINLTIQNKPLHNEIICTVNSKIINYNETTKVFEYRNFFLNDSLLKIKCVGLGVLEEKNITVVLDNAELDIKPKDYFYGLKESIQINFTNNNLPIYGNNFSCNIKLNNTENVENMTYNFMNNLYEYNITPYENFGYNISCGNKENKKYNKNKTFILINPELNLKPKTYYYGLQNLIQINFTNNNKLLFNNPFFCKLIKPNFSKNLIYNQATKFYEYSFLGLTNQIYNFSCGDNTKEKLKLSNQNINLDLPEVKITNLEYFYGINNTLKLNFTNNNKTIFGQIFNCSINDKTWTNMIFNQTTKFYEYKIKPYENINYNFSCGDNGKKTFNTSINNAILTYPKTNIIDKNYYYNLPEKIEINFTNNNKPMFGEDFLCKIKNNQNNQTTNMNYNQTTKLYNYQIIPQGNINYTVNCYGPNFKINKTLTHTINKSTLNNLTDSISYYNISKELKIEFINILKNNINNTCTVSYLGKTYNMTRNGTKDIYNYSFKPIDKNIILNFICKNPINKITLSKSIPLEVLTPLIDNFTVSTDYNIVNLADKTFNEKNITLNITSFGLNNINPVSNSKYFFKLSFDLEGNDKIIDWTDIGKNERINLNAIEGQNYTNYILENGTIGNYSKYVFRNELSLDKSDKEIFAHVKVCSYAFNKENCYFNKSDYFVFKDITPPNITRSIGDNYINRLENGNISFNYKVIDYESDVKTLKYNIIEKNKPRPEPENSITNFISNKNSLFKSNDILENGKFYNFFYRTSNKVNVLSDTLSSEEILVDLKNPVNSSINTTLQIYNYMNTTNITFYLNPGFDYNENYTILNLTESGLKNMKIFIKNATLSNNNCINWKNFVDSKLNLTSLNKTINLSFNTGKCYNVNYVVYDNALNEKQNLYNKTIKIDTTKPKIIIPIYDSDNTVNYDYDKNKTIFRLNWKIEDLESSIDYYNIYMYNSVGKVASFKVNNTFFDLKYNESYIVDATQYFFEVEGVNKAGIKSNKTKTDGIILYDSTYPELEILENNYFLNNSFIIDFDNTVNTKISFKDKNKLLPICYFSALDKGYELSKEENNKCITNQSTGIISCEFPTNEEKEYNFSISCRSSFVDSLRTKNNKSNNFDIKLLVHTNKPPKLYSINNNQSFLKDQEVLENEIITLDLNFKDDNINYNYYNKTENKTILFISNKVNVNLTNLNQYNITYNKINNENYQLIFNPEENGFIRNEIVKFYFNLSDGIDSKIQELNISVKPIYHTPILNNTYYKLNNNLSYNLYGIYDLNLSNYVYENNSEVGLKGNLYYNITTNGIKILDINNTDKKIKIKIMENIPKITVNTKNYANQSINFDLNLNLTSFKYPNVTLNSSTNFSYINKKDTYIDFNFTADKNLTNVSVIFNNLNEFKICEKCNQSKIYIKARSLQIGNNTLSLKYSLEDEKIHKIDKMFFFNFLNNKTEIENLSETILGNINPVLLINNNSNTTDLKNNKIIGIKNIEIKNGNEKLLEFKFNFSQNNLTTVATNIILNEKENKSSIVISNLELKNTTKTIYLPAPKNIEIYNSVCIKDFELKSITEISNNCKSTNEYFIKCNNILTKNGYSCRYNSTLNKYIISGLKHSGVIVMSELEYNKNNNNGNNNGNSGGSSSGGSSGGGGGGSSFSSKIKITDVIELNKSIEEKIQKKTITKLGDLSKLLEKEIKISEKSEITFNGKKYIGIFLEAGDDINFISGGKIIFTILKDGSLFDTNNNNQNDLEITFEKINGKYYINSEIISEKNEIIEKKTEPIIKNDKIETPEENFNYLPIIIGTIILILTISIIFIIKNKTKNQNKKVNKKLNKNNHLDNILNEVKISTVEKLKIELNNNLNNNLKDNINNINNNQTEKIKITLTDIKKIIKEGVSWSELYIYLKQKNISQLELKEIFDFKFLIEEIEHFAKKNKGKENLKELIVNEKWGEYCYFHNNIDKIKNDLAFMITGVGLYGFNKKRFLDFFNDELKTGLRTTTLSQDKKDYLSKKIKF